MQTSQIIACDTIKQSLGLFIAVKYSYPATTSGERINRTVVVSLPTIERLTILLMELDSIPLKNGRLAPTAIRIQKMMANISLSNRGRSPISVIALAAMAWGFHNYYQEHGYLPVPVPILPRANAKLAKGEDREPTRDEFLEVFGLEDFKIVKKPRKSKLTSQQVSYGKEVIIKPSLEDWLGTGSNENSSEADDKILKALEDMDKGMLS